MTKLHITLFALAMTAAGTFAAWSASGVYPAPAVSFPHSLKIVAFGSSSTEGIGASRPAAAYPAQLQAILRQLMPTDSTVTVINRGVGGEDADDMLRRLRRDVIDRHPDLVIFQTGSNDPMRHVPLARFEHETRQSIVAMQTAGISVILMEPQWCPALERIATAHDYRDTLRKIGEDMHVPVVRRSDLMHDWIRQGLLTKGEMLASDGLHMRDQGYALLARWVASEILRLRAFGTAAHPVTVQRTI